MRVLGMAGSVVIKQSDSSEEGSQEELHLSVSRVNCLENHEMRLFPLCPLSSCSFDKSIEQNMRGRLTD